MSNIKTPKDLNDIHQTRPGGVSLEELENAAEPMPLPDSKTSSKEDTSTIKWIQPNITWLAEAPPHREWLVRAGSDGQAPGFLPRAEVGILAAPGSSGKTWALVALALAVCTGRRWLGYATFPKAGRAVLLVAEETGDEVRRRVQAQARLMGIQADELMGRLVILAREGMPPEGPALVQPYDWNGQGGGPSPFGLRVLSELQTKGQEEGGWDLIVADPLSAFGPPDCEVDNAAATATMRAVEQLCSLPGNPTVLVAHHTRKGTGKDGPPEADDIRGASGLVNRARWAATLQSITSPFEGARVTSLQVVKANYCPPLAALLYWHPHQGNGAIRRCTSEEEIRIQAESSRKLDDKNKLKIEASKKKADKKNEVEGDC